jgi:hypothetical protein
MPQEQIQIDPIKQRKLSEFIQNEIERSGFDPSVIKYYGIELSPEDLSVLNQLQKVNQDIERWKKTGWLNKLWHHALGTFTFGFYSDNAPPPEIAEKEGGLLYKQIYIPGISEIYKFLFSDYGLSLAGLAEGAGFIAQIPLGIRLWGLAGRGAKALGFLERLGIDKVIEEEIRNPLIRDGFYKWLHKSNTNKFIWDSFKLGVEMAPWAGYGAVREMRWAGESPTLSDWIEGTAEALPFTIFAAGPAMTLMTRGIAKGWNRYQAVRLLDKRLGTLSQEAERVLGTAIDDEVGRKAIRTIDEFIRDINEGLHNKGILEKISDFSPENIGSTQHNLGMLRQSLDIFVKTSPERIGLLYDALDSLKDIPYFQKIKGILGDNFSRFMDNVKELKRFVDMTGDDLGLQYLFKNSEELLAVKDKIPELAPRLIKSIESIDDFLRKELYGKFIPEIAERVFGKEGQAMPSWSFAALKNWLQSMGLVHETAKDFAKVSNITRQQLAHELFNRPELLEALSYIAPETMRDILGKRNEVFDKLTKLFDEELIPLWKQLPDDIKNIFNEKAKTELLKEEELGSRLKFNLDENLNIKNVEQAIRQSPQEIEKTLGQRISNVFDWSNMENVKKFVENEIRPRYGEALAQWEEIPEKTQEFLSNVQTLLRYGGVENVKEWLSKQPALDEVVDLAKKVDRMSVDPLGQDLLEFLGQHSFVGKNLAENRAKRITNADKLGLLKGVFASGITDEERLLSFSYRVFDSREAQTLFVNQYVNAYINGTLSEFLDRQYPVIYNFLKKSIPSLPKEYSVDNFINAIRAIQDDAIRMRIEATARNGGIDPFVSKKEFLEQLFRVNQHDLVRTTEATKEAIREIAQEEISKKGVFRPPEELLPGRSVTLEFKIKPLRTKEPPIKNVPEDLKDAVEEAKKIFPYRVGDEIDEILDGRRLSPGDRAEDIRAILGRGRYMQVVTTDPHAETFSEMAERLGYDDMSDFVRAIKARMEHRKNWSKEILKQAEYLQYGPEGRPESGVKPRSKAKETSPMNLTVSPTFKVLEQFLGKDTNEVHNELVSYLENTGFFEDPSKLNLTELSQIIPKITKKIADIESIPLIFRGKMFDIDTKKTFQEGERTMVNLVSLTGEKEIIPVTKEFALWLKYMAKTIENIEGRRPSIEEIIRLIKEPFTTEEMEISDLDLYY